MNRRLAVVAGCGLISALPPRISYRDNVEFDEEAAMESKRRMAALENEKKKEDTRMSQWIDAVFGDAFIAYTHLKALSAFVEAVLRYGLNKDGAPDYVSFLVKPWAGKACGLAFSESPGLKSGRDLLKPACPRVG